MQFYLHTTTSGSLWTKLLAILLYVDFRIKTGTANKNV